jgi:outer membrane protein
MDVKRVGLLAAAGAAALAVGGSAVAQPQNQMQSPTPPVRGDTDTLREALEQTYRSNPTLMAQRERLRALDESVAIARSGLRPNVSANAGINQDLFNNNSGEPRNFSIGLDVSYPLFNADRVRNQIRAADARVEAGRADLRGTEGDIFTEAVGAYMDVIRDRSIVSLNENQVRVLQTNLEATRDRFEVGDLTRTDVAQSEARLALAQSALATAQGRLRSSEEAFRRIIGDLPADLDPPPALPRLPATADEAVAIALDNNPDLRAVANQVRAAGLDIDVLRADRLPTVNAVGSGDYLNRLGSSAELLSGPPVPGQSLPPNEVAGVGVGVQARIPIYQGGLVGARVRQSTALRSQLVEQAIETERFVIARTRAAFATYRAALNAIQSNEIAVAANQLALEGTRAEQTVGTRNTLDVLNAEQELLNSEVQLVTARRDAYVAGFALLNAMGRAEAEDLGLDGGPLYDPLSNYNRTRNRGSDWNDGSDEDRGPASTRTAPPNASSPIAPLIGPVDPAAPGRRTDPVTGRSQ